MAFIPFGFITSQRPFSSILWAVEQPVRLAKHLQASVAYKVQGVKDNVQFISDKINTARSLASKSIQWISTNAPILGRALYANASVCVQAIRDINRHDQKLVYRAAAAICSFPFVCYAARSISNGIVALSNKVSLSIDLSSAAKTHKAAAQPIFGLLAATYLCKAILDFSNLHAQVNNWVQIKKPEHSLLKFYPENSEEQIPAHFAYEKQTRLPKRPNEEQQDRIEKTMVQIADFNPGDSQQMVTLNNYDPADTVKLIHFFEERIKILKGELPPPEDIEAYATESHKKFNLLNYMMQNQMKVFRELNENGLIFDRRKLYDHIKGLGEIPKLDPQFENEHDRSGELGFTYKEIRTVKEYWDEAVESLNPDKDPEAPVLDPMEVLYRAVDVSKKEIWPTLKWGAGGFLANTLFFILIGKEAAAMAALQYALKQVVFSTFMASSVTGVSSLVNDICCNLLGNQPSSVSRNLSTALTFTILSVV